MMELGLHVIVISNPLHTTVEESLQCAERLFEPTGVHLVHTIHRIPAPDLEHIEIGVCDRPGVPLRGPLHEAMFSMRCDAGNRDLALYFITSTRPPLSGCAQHPPNVPGALLTAIATRWTLAHEIGHILGLSHRSGNTVLMTPETDSITVDQPELAEYEVDLLRKSPWLNEVTP